MTAYRDNADPNVDQELHTLAVSVSKGSTAVGCLVTVALLFVIAFIATLVGGAFSGLEGLGWIFLIPGFVIGGLAYSLNRKRHRTLRIVRHGETLRLDVVPDDVSLTFPLELHGMQFMVPIGRGSKMTEVYLQLVDAKKNAVLLHEVRGAIYGKYDNWFAGDMDKSVHSATYDIGGLDTLEKVREWIETLSKESA